MKTHRQLRRVAMRWFACFANLITVLGLASALQESVRANSFVIQPVEAQSSTTFTWQGAFSADNFRNASEFSADDAALIDADSPVPTAWPTGIEARPSGYWASGFATYGNDAGAWPQVIIDLGASYDISGIVLWNGATAEGYWTSMKNVDVYKKDAYDLTVPASGAQALSFSPVPIPNVANAPQVLPLSLVNTRYILLNCKDSYANWFAGQVEAREIRFIGLTAGAPFPPAIQSPPATRTVAMGTNVNLTVAAVGAATLLYQWQREVGGVFTPLSNGGNIAGTATATLTLTNAQPADSGSYQVVVTNGDGSATSAPASLAVAGLPETAIAMPPLTLAQFPDLPVTTGYLGNSLMRGGGIGWELFNPKATYLQLYTTDMVASPDGMLFCTTTWEEGHAAAGIYRDGDALPDQPPFSTTSGHAVAVNDKWLVYSRDGELALFTRKPGVAYERASGRRIRYQEGKDVPWGTGVVLNGDIAQVSSDGKLYTIDLVANKVTGEPVAIPKLERLRRDQRGTLWGIVQGKPETFTSLPITVSGDSEADHPAADALRNEGDNIHWLDKSGPAALLIDLQQEAKPAIMRFTGAGWDVSLLGAKISGAASAEGPWTDLITFDNAMGWWPESVVTLDERPWRYLRISSDKSAALRALQVQVRIPMVPGAVIGVNQAGKEIARLPEIGQPIGLDYDAAHDRILVFNNDADQQIHAFNKLDTTPQRDVTWMQKGRFGAKGGLSSAKGAFGPARFDLVRGIAVDGKGNLNVFGVGGTGSSQSRLESYAPDGTRLWDMKGLAFLDAVETDPGDPNTAYSALTRYVRDPKGRDGDGWRAVGTTVDRFANTQDPRVHGNLGHIMGVRRIAGKPFLFATSQYSNPMAVYRFDKDGIAIPGAFFVSLGGGQTFPPNEPAGSAWKMWQDTNGDGLFQLNEWQVGEQLVMHYFTVDSSGSVWFVDPRSKGIRHLGVAANLDAHGSPTWPRNLNTLYPAPAAFPNPDQMRGLEVSPDGTSLFVFGFTPELPNVIGMNHPLGRLLVRYDINGKDLIETHRTIIPYDLAITAGTPKDQSYASSIAGDFLFIGYERHMATLVLRHSDLTPVGHLAIGPQSQCPTYDGPSELIATKVGPRYELFMSMYTGNATTQLTWDPGITKRLDTPAVPTGTREGSTVKLAWATIPGATSWQIERRALLPDGWGPWEAMSTTQELAWTDAKAPATAGYRFRAGGGGTLLSDWSMTAWMR